MAEDIATVACDVCGETAVVPTYALGSAEMIEPQLPPGWEAHEEHDPVTGISQAVVRCPEHRTDR